MRALEATARATSRYEPGSERATQSQALCALVFLYKHVLETPLAWLDDLERAKKPIRLPVVLSRDEVARVRLAGGSCVCHIKDRTQCRTLRQVVREEHGVLTATVDEMATHWIRYQLESDAADFWSVEDLLGLTATNPMTAWSVICAVWERTREPIVLAVLAAGPMEELLGNHGALIVPKVIDYVACEPGFRSVLRGMYRNQIDADVWQEVQRLSDDQDGA